MARELPDWLAGYLEYTEPSEPPRSYHLWCGLSLIAGALQRKVYLPWGIGQVIYPNMFVVLVGASGRTRKGVALGIAKDLLVNVSGVSCAPEASSREAMILAMKRAVTNFEDPSDHKIKFHCSLTAFSEELSVLLGQSDIKLLANLTDWFDSKDEWAYETIGRGRDALQGLCFNLLGATAPDWLQSMLPAEAVGGGFTSRVIFVVEERKGKTVPKHDPSVQEIELKESLIRDLDRISQLKGSVNFSPAGEKAYIDWYVEQDQLLAKGQMAVDDTRFAGYCERRATHIRKLMILSSASRGDSMQLTEEDFQSSKEILGAAESKMHKTFGGLGKSKHGDVTEPVMDYIRNLGVTTRSVLMARFYRDLDADTLRRIEEQLTQMKVISIKLLPDQAEKIYTWVGKR